MLSLLLQILLLQTSAALNKPAKTISQYPPWAEAGENEEACEFFMWAPLDVRPSQSPSPESPGHGSQGMWSVFFLSQTPDGSVRQQESPERWIKLP